MIFWNCSIDTSWKNSARDPAAWGTIFRKAQNCIQDPANLKRLIVDLIDKENWSATGIAGDWPWTERIWVYVLRTNQHFTLKQNPLRRSHSWKT